MTNNDFGKNVVSTREALGISRSELQRKLEAHGQPMHMTSLRRIESGEQEPKLSEAKAIAEVLGLSVEQLDMQPDRVEQLRDVWLMTAAHKAATDRMAEATLAWSLATGRAFAAIKAAAEAGVPLQELREPLTRIQMFDNLELFDQFLEPQSDQAADEWTSSSTALEVMKVFRDVEASQLRESEGDGEG